MNIAVGKIILTDYGSYILLNCQRAPDGATVPPWIPDYTLGMGNVGIIERIGDYELLYHPTKGTAWHDWASRCQFRSATDGSQVATLAEFIVHDGVRRVGLPFEYSKMDYEFPMACRRYLLDLRNMSEGVGSNDAVKNIWRIPVARHYCRSLSSGPPSAEEAILMHGFDVLMNNELAASMIKTVPFYSARLKISS